MGDVFNNTFGMLWSDGEKPTTTFLQNVQVCKDETESQNVFGTKSQGKTSPLP
jgi:hypothetical protein